MKNLMKAEIKSSSIEIKELKKTIKETQKAKGSGAAASEQGSLHYMKVRIRHLFIAYGQIRGKTVEQVEASSLKDGIRTHSEKMVEKIIEEFEKKDAEKV